MRVATWHSLLLVLGLGLAGCGLIRSGQPAAGALAARPGFDWQTSTIGHFTVYYEAASPAARRLERIELDAEASLRHVLALLGETTYEAPLALFVVSSRARMRDLVGHETNGTAFPRTGVLAFIVGEDLALGARHELLHVVAETAWGPPSELWVTEGLAVYADDHWHGHDLHALSHHLADGGRLIPLRDLVGRFRGHADLVTYPQAGSLVRHVYEAYGRDAVRALWARGAAASVEATGRTLEALEAEWLEAVQAADASGIEYER